MEAGIVAIAGLVLSLISGGIALVLEKRAANSALKQATEKAKNDQGQFSIELMPRLLQDDANPVINLETAVQVTSSIAERQPTGTVLSLTTKDEEALGKLFDERLRVFREQWRKEQQADTRKAEKRAFITNFALSAFFFIAGVGATLLVSG